MKKSIIIMLVVLLIIVMLGIGVVVYKIGKSNAMNDIDNQTGTSVDLSWVAGEYVDSNGNTMTLYSNGLCSLDPEGAVVYLPLEPYDGHGEYSWSISWDPNPDEGGGFTRVIYPIGVPVTYQNSDGSAVAEGTFPDDTSKIRLFDGQEMPKSAESIWYKK